MEKEKPKEWLWDTKREQWYHHSIKEHRAEDNKRKRVIKPSKEEKKDE